MSKSEPGRRFYQRPNEPAQRDTQVPRGAPPPEDEFPLGKNGRPNPMSYPKSAEPFDPSLFKRPSAEYRGCPLAAWNVKLTKGRLLRQVDSFKEMGFGGFFMHVRTGLDTEYMGDEFMGLVEDCVEYAEEKGMHACLYDEDRWPSGAAGGLVVAKEPQHKGKHLLFTTRPYGSAGPPGGDSPSSARASRSENGKLLAKYVVALDDAGCLRYWASLPTDGAEGQQRQHHQHRRQHQQQLDEPVGAEAFSQRRVWYAYVETNPGSPWFNGQTYVDTLSPAAMASFIRSTYDRYRDQRGVGSRFGAAVPCMFTDEPQFATKMQLSSPAAADDIFLPWTGDLPETLAAAHPGVDLLAQLPELVWDLPGGEPSVARYRFHDHVCERFVTAFMDQVGGWCAREGIFLTGHMMEEPTLHSQTTALGEAMRCYRRMQIPGIDLLNDSVEYNTAKQASSVARQRGVRGAFTEIYGCTHWTFPFEGHKGCGDWQAALGITFRSPHLAWLGMKGEAKRDYPASICHQSPWFREYGPVVEDHFARVAVAMTRGVAVTRVAVVHPIESFWLCFGPGGGTASEQERSFRDAAFSDLTDWLLHGLVDFDFVCESLLPSQAGAGDAAQDADGTKFRVGHCRYDVVILPNLYTIRSTTVEIVRGFQAAGGSVIVAGQSPRLVDAADNSPSMPALLSMLDGAETVPWHKGAILKALERHREIAVSVPGGEGHRLLHQIRRDGNGERFVFICNTDRSNAVDVTVQLRGVWSSVELWDTLTGEKTLAPHVYHIGGWTGFPHRFEGCGSVVLRLMPSKSGHHDGDIGRGEASQTQQTPPPFPSPHPRQNEEVGTRLKLDLVRTDLSEPNVLVLDYAQYKLGSTEGWSAPTEVLRIDNELRQRLGIPRKGSAWKQPWAVPASERKPRARLAMRFTFQAEKAGNRDQDDGNDASSVFGRLSLALEDAADWKLSINGRDFSVKDRPEAWWVDEDISVVPVPEGAVVRGENTLMVEGDFGVLTNLERIYLLGRGLDVHFAGPGRQRPVLKPAPQSGPGRRTGGLAWGDIVDQGLPFYVGNVTYAAKFTLGHCSRVVLSVPHFSSPVLSCRLLANDFEHDDSEPISNEARGRRTLKTGHIAYQPRQMVLGDALEPGRYVVEITAFGNRFNSFGHFHLPEGYGGCWPDQWRTGGGGWTDSYILHPIGVLEAPELIVHQNHARSIRMSAEWVMVEGDGCGSA